MTGPTWRLVPILAGLLLALTYLLVRGASPDPVLHERILQALHELTLNDAALHRDMLRARAGLLPNYDPLVQASRGVSQAIDTLRVVGAAPYGGSGAGIEPRLRGLIAEAAEQEALVERFKSDNALLQNSLAYFTHASQKLGGHENVATEVGALVNAMLQFMRDPREEIAAEVESALNRLVGLPDTQLAADADTLAAHGRLVLHTLPEVDTILGVVLNGQTAERARALQGAYLDYHAGIEVRAQTARILLYAASVLLLGYLAYLFLRLRANARALAERSSALQERVTFEGLITDISTHFINLPPDRVDRAIIQALAELGEYTGVDRAYILLFGADGRSHDRSHAWHRAGVEAPVARGGDLPAAEWPSSLERFVQQGSVHVPAVRELPSSPEKTSLAQRGIRSWLCLPMWCAGRRVGLLGFDVIQAEKRWSDDDIALLRTVGEIFANALERKRAEAEREALEAQLRQSQRMEAIGTLAGGIAHNFNNILGAILGYGEMALAALPSGGGQPGRYVQQVMTAGQRGKALVDQILAFSRSGEHERRPLRVQPVLKEAIDLLRASLPATIQIRLSLDAEDAAVLGDPTQLQQVVVNLSANAAQAMDGRGTLEVALHTVELASERALFHGSLPAGRYVRLVVSDRGRGMDHATLERIFEPFFTTRAAGGGTGLGLSTVHGIVAEHGGSIDVKSRPGEGSVFEVFLPQTNQPASAEPPRAPMPCGRGETVLLVDDETSIVLLGEEMLAALGYEPVGFDSGDKALAAFRADPDRFDLVLTDEIMPGITGTQLAGALHRMRPQLPILLMTGHGGPIEARGLRAAGVCEVLRKPLSTADIAASLARHLAPRRRACDR
jgi:signal transduction histidine kinase/CheY-like chemotaxis protein